MTSQSQRVAGAEGAVSDSQQSGREPADIIQEGGETVRCEVCGKELERITWTHLKTHGMSVKEYKEKFPGAELESVAWYRKCRIGVWSNEQRNKKLSRTHTGEGNPNWRGGPKEKPKKTKEEMYGKDSQWYKNMKKVWSGRKTGVHKHTTEAKIKMGRAIAELHKQGVYDAEVYKKVSAKLLGRFTGENNVMKRPEVVKKMFKSLALRPTKLEERFIKLCDELNLPFIYVGDGEYLVGNKCPDFVSEDKTIVILTHGIRYHLWLLQEKDPTYTKEDEELKDMMFYEKHGYRCVILWEDNDNETWLRKNPILLNNLSSTILGKHSPETDSLNRLSAGGYRSAKGESRRYFECGVPSSDRDTLRKKILSHYRM